MVLLSMTKSIRILLTATAILLPTFAQTQLPAGSEWRQYASDLYSSKYSPLDQINASNY